jgi:hypothetical protein
MREYARSHPEVQAQWIPVMESYGKGYERFTDTFPEGDTLLDLEWRRLPRMPGREVKTLCPGF